MTIAQSLQARLKVPNGRCSAYAWFCSWVAHAWARSVWTLLIAQLAAAVILLLSV